MVVQSIRDELPPKVYLELVATHQPRACLTYIKLWEKRDKNNKVTMTQEDVSYLWHMNEFKANLRRLNQEGLLDYILYPGKIYIELVNYDEIE